MKIELDIPDDLLVAYREYAAQRGCSLEQALLIPIEELASVFDMANCQYCDECARQILEEKP